MSDFFDNDFFDRKFTNGDWIPAVNVIENDANYKIEVLAPGLKKDEFSVQVENGMLHVSGKTEKESEEKEKNYTRKEFSSRSFSKSFTLPDNANEDAIEAVYEDGILHLTLAKSEKKLPPKRIWEIE